MNKFDKIKEKIDKNTKGNYPHRGIFMWMMNDIPIFSQGPKGGDAQWLQLTSESSSPVTSCTWVQIRKRLGTLKSIQMTQEENWMNLQNKLRACILDRSTQSWKDVSISRKENWSEMVQTCTSAAVIFICKDDHVSHQLSQRLLYLEKVNEINLESQQSTLLLFWHQESGRTSLSLDLDLTLLKLSQVVLRKRRENLLALSNQQTREAVVQCTRQYQWTELLMRSDVPSCSPVATNLRYNSLGQRNAPTTMSETWFRMMVDEEGDFAWPEPIEKFQQWAETTANEENVN